MIPSDKIQLIGQELIKMGFKVWFRFMFKKLENRVFIIEPIHDDLFIAFESIHKLDILRQIINLPPRSGKTVMSKYFIAYCLAINPKCNFIYTSFSQSLLVNISEELAGILENPIYKDMYNNNIEVENIVDNPINDFWKEYAIKENGKPSYTSKKITTAQNGTILFASVGSAITGFGCKSFDTLVSTNQGYLKMGDIVENKLDILIHSYNFKTKSIELKGIERYIKNEISNFLTITLDNGEVIECTDDHIFYKNYNEEIRADELLIGDTIPSYSFNNTSRNIKFFSNILIGIIFIKNKINIFIRYLCFIMCYTPSILMSKTFCNSAPVNTSLNVGNIRDGSFKLIGNILIWSFITCYCLYFIVSIFNISVMSSVSYTILFVVGLCTIYKIINIIIKRISINMSNNKTVRFSNKSESNKAMDSKLFTFCKSNIFITFFVNKRFQNYIRDFREYFSISINKIHFVRRDRKIINIVNSNHKSSYCVSIRDNNNFFVSKSQVLVHNCGERGATVFSGCLIIDDMNKPADIYSEVMRLKTSRYYEETLLTRLNDSNVPIINIQQRLHLEDITGFLMENYKFNLLKKPLVVNGVCQINSQYDKKRLIELQRSEYLFASQYQQEPIARGGIIFKKEMFKFGEILELEEYNNIFATFDTALKAEQSNDYTGGSIFGIKDNKLYLIDAMREKVEAISLPNKIEKFVNRYEKHKLHYTWIEDKGSGITLNQGFRTYSSCIKIPNEEDLKKHMTPCKGRDKIERANEIIPFINEYDKNIIINEDIEILQDITTELLSFPQSIHDDWLDTFIYGIYLFEKYYKNNALDFQNGIDNYKFYKNYF